jgi:hypothetical protein
MKNERCTGLPAGPRGKRETYRGDRAGLRVLQLRETDDVPYPERQCRLRMTLGWLSGLGGVHCGHFVSEGLPEFGVLDQPGGKG